RRANEAVVELRVRDRWRIILANEVLQEEQRREDGQPVDAGGEEQAPGKRDRHGFLGLGLSPCGASAPASTSAVASTSIAKRLSARACTPISEHAGSLPAANRERMARPITPARAPS